MLKSPTALLVCLSLASAPFAAQAAEIMWTGASNTTFSTAGNWSPAVTPGASDVAIFGATVTSNLPSIVSGNQSLNGLKFLSTNGGWTIGGAGTLTMPIDAATGPAFIDDSANTGGVDTISNLIFNNQGTAIFNGGGGGGGNLNVLGNFTTRKATFAMASGTVTFQNFNTTESFTKEGPGTLVITGANTGAGGMTVSSGKLVIGNNMSLGTGIFKLYRGGELQASSDVTVTNTFEWPSDGASSGFASFYGVISGSNNIAFNGLVNGSGSSTFFLANNLASGKTLTFSNVGITTSSGKQLNLGGTGNTVFNGVISNGGASANSIQFAGTGTTTLKGANTYTGGTTVSAGKTRLEGATGSIVSGNSLTLGNSGAYAGSGTFDYDNVGAAGNVSQTFGTLTFSSGDSTIRTTRTSTNGTVTLTFASLPARTSTLNSTRTFDYAGTVGTIGTDSKIVFTTWTAASNALIDAGTYFGGGNYAAYDSGGFMRAMNYTSDNSGNGVTVAATNTTFAAAGATSKHVDLGTTGVISEAGSETINTLRIGGTNTVTLASGSVLSITNGGILKTGGNASTISGGTQLQGGYQSELVIRTDTAADSLTIDTPISNGNPGNSGAILVKTGAGTLTLNGAVTLNNSSGGITIQNGTLVLGNTLYGPLNVKGGGTLDIDAGSQTVGAVTLANGAITSSTGVLTSTSSYTLNSGTVSAILAGGSGGLTKSDGNGVATLTRSNSYTGTTTVSGGILNISNSDALGSSAAGTTVSSSATLQLQGNINVAAEALTLNGTGVNAAGALNNLSGNNTWGGALSLGSASRIQSQAGTLTISNASAITGATFGLTVGGYGNTKIDSVIGTTSGTLTKDGYGKLTLTASNTYTGLTTISSGVLNIQKATALGATNGGTTLTAGATLQLQGGITVTDEDLALRGFGYSAGGALQNVSGDNTWTKTITNVVNSRINADAGTLTLSGGINGNANQGITFGGAGNIVVSGAITNSTAGLNKDGAGVVTLSGANTYSGNTTVSQGILTFANTSARGGGSAVTAGANGTIGLGVGAVSGDYTSANVASLFNSSLTGFTLNTASGVAIDTTAGNFTQDVALTAARALTKLGANTLTVTANNTYSGATTISNGTLQVGNGSDAGSIGSTSAITNNGALIYNVGNGTRTNGSVISGSGSLTQSSSGGKLILTGNNSYAGGTALNAGSLRLDGATAAGTGTITQADGTSLLEINTTGTVTNAMSIYKISTLQTVTLSGNKTLNNATYTVAGGTTTTDSGNLSGTGGVTKQGTGTLTLTGDNSYTGAVAVNEGLLNLNSSTGGAAATASTVSVASGATLLVSQNNQVNNSAAVTLSGGTIQRAGGVSEAFGNLNLTSGSFLDFGTGVGGTMSFGTYTPSLLLTVKNFSLGNTLTFGQNLTGTINNTSYFSFDNGFTSSWNNETSTFTITAIPEPSTYLAATGLIGLMLWPTRRRFLRDVKRFLGIRPPAHERLRRYRHVG